MYSTWYIENRIVRSRVKKYKKQYPNEKILFAGHSKAISRAFEKEVKVSAEFTDAKRTVFILTDKYVIAREWRIKIEEITHAELNTYDSLYGKAMFLKLKTRSGANYQFGMRYDERFFKQNVLRFEHRELKHVYPTWFKLTYRILMPIWKLFIIGLIIYGLIRLFRWIGS
jgi:hypothetical protein